MEREGAALGFELNFGEGKTTLIVPSGDLSDADRARFVLNQIEGASLANLASTSLSLLGYESPADYRPALLKALR